MWDVRARACVYELSTGNNSVVTMLWDEKRTTLLAATERNFYRSDYRKTKFPQWATWNAIQQGMKAYTKSSTRPSTSTPASAGESTGGEEVLEDSVMAEDDDQDWVDVDDDDLVTSQHYR